jgi:hypothetical protein
MKTNKRKKKFKLPKNLSTVIEKKLRKPRKKRKNEKERLLRSFYGIDKKRFLPRISIELLSCYIL